MVSVYCVFVCSAAVGLNVNVLPPLDQVPTPAPGFGTSCTLLRVESIASENVIDRLASGFTLVVPFAGDVDTSVGGVWSLLAWVVNDHDVLVPTLVATSVPATITVNELLYGSGADGVRVSVAPSIALVKSIVPPS